MYSLANTDTFRYPGDDVYVLSVTRASTDGLVALATDQTLSLFKPSALSAAGPVTAWRVGGDGEGAAVATMSMFGEAAVATAGGDGRVRVWDLRGRDKVAEFIGELEGTRFGIREEVAER